MTTAHVLIALAVALATILILARWSQRRYGRRRPDPPYWEGP